MLPADSRGNKYVSQFRSISCNLFGLLFQPQVRKTVTNLILKHETSTLREGLEWTKQKILNLHNTATMTSLVHPSLI